LFGAGAFPKEVLRDERFGFKAGPVMRLNPAAFTSARSFVEFTP
jgi:hypothetical protein